MNDDQGSLMIEWPVLYQKIDEWIQRMAQQGYNAVALPADISGIPLEAIAAAPDRPDARSDVTYDLLELLLRKFDQQGFKSFVFIESINDDAVGSQASVGLPKLGIWVTELWQDNVFAIRFDKQRHQFSNRVGNSMQTLARKYSTHESMAGVIVVTSMEVSSDESVDSRTIDDELRRIGALPMADLTSDPRSLSELIVGCDAAAVFDLSESAGESNPDRIKELSNVLCSLPAQRFVDVPPTLSGTVCGSMEPATRPFTFCDSRTSC